MDTESWTLHKRVISLDAFGSSPECMTVYHVPAVPAETEEGVKSKGQLRDSSGLPHGAGNCAWPSVRVVSALNC